MPTHSTYSSSVDVATGAVLSYGFDFYLNGVIPLEIERLWFSDSDFSGRLGYGVHSILDIQLKIDEESIGLLTKEGDSISFPRFFSLKKLISTSLSKWKRVAPLRESTISGIAKKTCTTTLPKEKMKRKTLSIQKKQIWHYIVPI